MSKYNLGLCSVSFRKNTPKEILSAMKDAGLTHIEWGSDIHAPIDNITKINEIIELQKEYVIQCSSYGTYFCIGTTPIDELPLYINIAKSLGTNVLRVWCGNKNSQDYSIEEKEILFEECKKAAKIAEKNEVVLCMECHINTYTNTKESAFELITEVNSESFKMYWQPNQYTSESENIEYAKLLSPYTVNLHVFNWKMENKYPLDMSKDLWKKYLSCFNDNKTLLLEFMPDDNIESLRKETSALKEIIK